MSTKCNQVSNRSSPIEWEPGENEAEEKFNQYDQIYTAFTGAYYPNKNLGQLGCRTAILRAVVLDFCLDTYIIGHAK